MLRIKKILVYVAERLQATSELSDATGTEDSSLSLRPEEYLEIYCNDQVCLDAPGHTAPLLVTNDRLESA